MSVNISGGALEWDAIINDSQFGATIRRIEAQLQGLTTTATKEANAIDKLISRTITAIAGYATFAAATNFVSDIVRVRGEFQQLSVAFETMLGSKEKADQLLAEVTKFAATTPFELTEVAKATKQLLAFGISADKIIGTLTSLGDVSAGIGAPLGDIAYLFGTIKTQGVALTQDVRQFAQRGIPVYEELAKILGVTTEQVGDFITAGKVGFPEIEKVFKNLTSEGSKFGGLMEAQSKTLTGLQSNLRDAIDQMLNNLGKSSEGVFATAIKGAIDVVENYDKVIDIIKVLVIAYGSYKAAVIATAAVQAIATAAAKGYTVVELLRYQAMVLSERAMKLLNATMLKNPAAFVVAGIAAMIGALSIFGKRVTEAKSKADLLAVANEKAADSFAEQEAKIRPYLEALKDGNVSEEKRLNIYNKLKAINPDLVAGLDAKTFAYKNLADNVDKYLKALRSQLKLEAGKEAVTVSIKEEQQLQASINKKLKAQKKYNDQAAALKARGDLEGAGLAQFSAQELDSDIKVLNASLAAQQKVTSELGGEVVDQEGKKTEAVKRTITVIEEEIKLLKQQQEQQSTNSKEYAEFQKKIVALEAEKKRITGSTQAEIRSSQTLERKGNDLLEKRRDLLQEIKDRQADASASLNSTKQTSEIDKINDRYDALIKNISEYNNKVDEFNKKNPKSAVQKIGQVDIAAANAARKTEIDVVYQKEELERFKKSLGEKQTLFERYEEAKKQVGLQKANELFGEQTEGYSSFLKLLNDEALRLRPKLQFGIATEAEIARFKVITDAISSYNKKKAGEYIDAQKDNFIELLSATVTFNQQKAEINARYDRLETELNKNRNLADFDERKKLLERGRQQDLDILNDQTAAGLDQFRRLFSGIEDLSDQAARSVIQNARKILDKLIAEGKISVEFAKEIQKALKQASESLDSRLPDRLNRLANSIRGLASSANQFNENLGSVLATLSEIVAAVSDVKKGLSDFKAAKKSGDALGQVVAGLGVVGAVAGLISSIVGSGKKAKEERQRREKELQEFLTTQFIGEQEINLLYQQRAREQVRINKLRLQGLQDEKQLLIQQQSQLRSQFDLVLAELQKETSRVIRSVDLGSLLGSQIFTGTQSLAGKSFEQLEELFLSGQLEGKAKELFLELQKIKEAGLDVDRLLEENKRAAQELFTGTTADSLIDSIKQGFAQGKRGIADFASTFEDSIRAALIQSLEFKALEGPLKDFFAEFAAASESDGALTSGEISQLQSLYNSIISNAQAQFDQLQQISGISLVSGGVQSNSLSGAIKGITEQQADLLAGQFGGLRITALEHVAIARQQMSALNAIQVNTGISASKLAAIMDRLLSYETGTKKLHVIV